MNAAVWAKVALLVLEGLQSLLVLRGKEEKRARIESIKNDPIGEWNRRFGGVSGGTADAAAEQPELPTPYSDAAICYFRGREAGTRRRGAIANVLRGRGDSVPVMAFARTMYEQQFLQELSGDDPLPLPLRQTEGSAGYDLPSAINIELAPGEQRLVPTGWRVTLPEGHAGQIWPRSGWAVKRELDRRAGIVDWDYRGELQVLLRNESSEPRTIRRGDRIGQLVVVPVATPDVIELTDFTDYTDRGSGGFGSTGGMTNG